MQNNQSQHFEEEGRVNPTLLTDRMPESSYSIALDHLVITCVDIVFLHSNQVLLARRNTYPRKSWWVIGGRMIAGENPLQTAQRKALEEARLNLTPERFRYLAAYSTCFARRQQPPIQHGSHSVNLTYCIELTETEKQQVRLKQEEYEANWAWVELDAVSQLLASRSEIDRALLRLIHDVQTRQHG
jgi:ADP-ribose pyrophosphatase YjhB (NUDIX family)